MSQRRRDQLTRDLFRDWLEDIVKWGLLYTPPFALIVTLFFDRYDGAVDFWRSFLKSMYIGEVVLIFSVTMSYILAVAESGLFKKLKRDPPERSDLFHTIRSLVFLIPGLSIAFKSLEYVSPMMNWQYAPPESGHYKFGILVGLFSIGIWLLYNLYTSKGVSEKKIQLLEKDQLSSKISALTAQMNPHLLFNALNTVAATIPENPEAAEKMVVELAGLYRKTLEATRTDFHSLALELELVKAYLTIEKSRFGERLNFQITNNDVNTETVIIPSLLLQPLVENAVKHGLASLEKGGSVSIALSGSKDVVNIEISDNGVGFANSKVRGTGTGLENCRRRLQLLYLDKAQFEIEENAPQGTRVRINIPKHLVETKGSN